MPGRFINTGTNPNGKLSLTNVNNQGNLTMEKLNIANLVLSLDAGNSASYPGTGTVWTDLVAGRTFDLYNGP